MADKLRLSERTVYKMVRERKLPAARVGGVYRLNEQEINEWLREQSSTARAGIETGENDQALLLRIKDEPDQLRKRLMFVGLTARKLGAVRNKPVIVGGVAVEFYTAGGYATTGIDLVYPSEPLDEVFGAFGMESKGRFWYSEELGILVKAPSAFLDSEAKERLIQVKVDDLTVFILGVEDLIADRLNAYVHWKSTDDGNWVRELIAIHAGDIDWAYLKKTATADKTGKALEALIADLGIGKEALDEND